MDLHSAAAGGGAFIPLLSPAQGSSTSLMPAQGSSTLPSSARGDPPQPHICMPEEPHCHHCQPKGSAHRRTRRCQPVGALHCHRRPESPPHYCRQLDSAASAWPLPLRSPVPGPFAPVSPVGTPPSRQTRQQRWLSPSTTLFWVHGLLETANHLRRVGIAKFPAPCGARDCG